MAEWYLIENWFEEGEEEPTVSLWVNACYGEEGDEDEKYSIEVKGEQYAFDCDWDACLRTLKNVVDPSFRATVDMTILRNFVTERKLKKFLTKFKYEEETEED